MRCRVRSLTSLHVLMSMTVLSLIIAGGSSPALGQDCADYGDYLHWQAKVYTSGDSKHVDLVGSHAYAAGNHFNVVDFSDPTAPALLASVDTPGYVSQVAVHGDYAYVADRHGGFQILNVAVPGWPWIVSSLATAQDATAVAFADGYAYVGDNSHTFTVIDVSDPNLPVAVGSTSLPDNTAWITIAGNLAYVATYWGGFQIIDISNPAYPQTIASLATPSAARAVVLHEVEALAYLAITNSGVQLVDISVPQSPSIVGTLPVGASVYDVAVSGDRLFVALNNGSLEVYDIAEAANPQYLGREDVQGTAWGVDVDGDRVCVVDDECHLIAINNGSKVAATASLNTTGTTRSLALSGSHVYLGSDNGIEVVDVSDPAAPVSVASLDYAGGIQNLVVVGDYLYALSFGDLSLLVIDISDPLAPVEVASLANFMFTFALAVNGNYIYVTGLIEMYILELSDPVAPVITTVPGIAGTGLTVSDDRLYLVGGGLTVFDLSDPVVPELQGSVALGGNSSGVQVVDNLAYVAGDWSGFYCVDVADPANPMPLGNILTQSQAKGVAVAGSVAYVTDAWSGLNIVNIEDPGDLIIAGTATVTGSGYAVVAGEDHVFVADGDLAIFIRDCRGSPVTHVLGNEQGSPPARTVLQAPYPNPFNPQTVIPYAVDRRQQLSLTIHDPAGRLVARLVDRVVERGSGQVVWDGTDLRGRPLASGVYLVRLHSEDSNDQCKVVLMK